jgi:hypothetical protein
MNGNSADRLWLYNLLPEIYRIRDAEEGGVLRALLAIIGREVDALEKDIQGLYDNLFIETCDEWVVPYIGDLIGTRILHPTSSSDVSKRAYVANTLAYRRRKGTATVLEQLACDVTGWHSRVVEYYRLLAMTQYLNHVRLDRHGLADLHNNDALDVFGGPFEKTAHIVDVRRIRNNLGRYNIPNLGLFLWRLKSYPVEGCRPYAIDTHRYTFNPLGLDIALFNNPRTEKEISHIADEINLPVMLRREALSLDLEKCREDSPQKNHEYVSPYFGDDPVLSVHLDGNEKGVHRDNLWICDLSGWDAPGWKPPESGDTIEVLVDPELGRFYLKDEADPVDVDYSYGFSGNIGGGPYDRRSTMIRKDPLDDAEREWEIRQDTPLPGVLSEWGSWDPDDSIGIITISHSSTCDIGQTIIDFSGRKNCSLWIQAADEECPVLNGSLRIKGDDPGGTLVLNGLLINGRIEIEAGALTSLVLVHCTLPPGKKPGKKDQPVSQGMPSLVYLPGDNGGNTATLAIRIDHSITGAISLPADLTTLTVEDSIIQSVSPGTSHLTESDLTTDSELVLDYPVAISGRGQSLGPQSVIKRTTIFGEVYLKELVLASEVIFNNPLKVQKTQTGCVRYCYLPESDSKTPRRYRCQPELTIEHEAADRKLRKFAKLTDDEKEAIRIQLVPRYTSTEYGNPGYSQLGRTCAEAICRGGENESEMGVFNCLGQPEREANLRAVLDEYLRFGLEAGLFYVT